jgi:serine/threonine protein phosphatase PrpC
MARRGMHTNALTPPTGLPIFPHSAWPIPFPLRIPTTSTTRASGFALTDRGQSREHNEDTFLVADLTTDRVVRGASVVEVEVGSRGALYLVADGMGGAAAGELASEMAAVAIHAHLREHWSDDPIITEQRFAHHLREAVEAANAILYAYATDHPDVRGMGTTATVAGVWGSHLLLAQIGDSRGYLVRGGEARQLTRDQSLTQRLVEVGELTEEEAAASARRNIILQALGPDPRVSVDLSWQQLQRGDLLILCSDGLSSVIPRPMIAETAVAEPDPAALCRALVDLANTHGGPDNITVIAVRFDGAGLPVRATGDEPGYHEFQSTDERPALLPTAAFPAASPPPPLPPIRRGSPTGLALLVAGVVLALVALVRWLT